MKGKKMSVQCDKLYNCRFASKSLSGNFLL